MVEANAAVPRVSARAYFGCVAVATVMGLALAMVLRPGFGHAVLQWSRLEPIPKAAANSFYTVRVAPLFAAHCTSCHGAERDKGGLRLDSLAAILRGGKHGAVVVADNAKESELVTRILLPASNDRAMPPSGKAPLNQDDITVIRLWIAAGASGVLPVGAIKGAPRLVAPVTVPEINSARVSKLRAPLASVVSRLQGRFPGVIEYDSRSSADLVINASLKREAFGDADLQALAPLREHIVEANLSNTAVTDASASILAGMPLLRVLRMMNTRVGDATLQALVSAKALRVLSVAKANPATLAPLRRKGVRIYESGDGE